MSKHNTWSSGFTQGYACAIAAIIKSHGNNGILSEAIKAGNLTEDNMRKEGVEESDIEAILSNKGW